MKREGVCWHVLALLLEAREENSLRIREAYQIAGKRQRVFPAGVPSNTVRINNRNGLVVFTISRNHLWLALVLYVTVC